MEDDLPQKKRGILEHRPLMVFLWAVLPIIAVFGVTIMRPSPSSLELIGNQSILELGLTQIVSVIIMLILPAILITYVYKRYVFEFLKLLNPPKLSHIALGALIILSANFFLNYLMELNNIIPLPDGLKVKFQGLQELTSEAQAFFLKFSGLSEFLIVFLTLAIFPAIAEEIYFRGLLIGVLNDMKIGAFHAIFISSILFAMMHFQFYYILPLLFMGGILGYVYYRTKNLWVSIFMHLLNNGLIVLLTLSNQNKITQVDLEANPPLYISAIGIIVFIISVYYFHQLTKSNKLKKV